MSNHDGYAAGSKVNDLINKQVQATPLTKDTAREWCIMARTVRTSVDILEKRALRMLQTNSKCTLCGHETVKYGK